MVQVQEIQCRDILTKSRLPDADFVINPYVGCSHKCCYCYAEFMKRFTQHKHENWGDFIDIKKFDKKLNLNKINGKKVFLSSVTDPYNHYEKKYQLTRNILAELVQSDAEISILTKSKMVVRDIEIFKSIKNIEVGISLCTLDDTFRRIIEPRTSSIDDRIHALAQLHQSGVTTYLFVSPVFPGLTDVKAIINKCKSFVDFFCFENLNLRGFYKKRVLDTIAEIHPDLLPLYTQIYHHKQLDYWETLREDIITECENNSLIYRMYFYHESIKK